MVYFVLPVFNEEKNLTRLVKTIHEIAKTVEIQYKIVAVDDYSQDQSIQTLKELSKDFPIELVQHSKNQGPGGAFQTGFDHVLTKANPSDMIITMDADNTHSTKTVGMIISSLQEGYEMVIASIFAPGGMLIGLPWLRYILTMSCNFIYQVLFPIRGIKEYTGFYRGYRVDMLLLAKQKLGGKLMTVSGFASMAELLIRLRRIPVFMKEVPMIVRYDEKGGKSKLRVWKTICEHLYVIRENIFKRNVL